MKIKNKKTIAILSFIILIAGIAMIVIKGYNFDLKYQDAKRIILKIGQNFNTSDIKTITQEVFGKEKVMIQKVEVFEDAVAITTKDITDEQKTNLINKINEKYGTTTEPESIELIAISHTRGRDIIKPYIIPFIIVTGIIVLYMMIRYYQLNMLKVLLKTVGLLVYTQLMLFSVIAITRIPVGRLTSIMVLTVYMLTLIYSTTKLENKIKEKEQEKKEEIVKSS